MKKEYVFSIAGIFFKLRLPHEIVVTDAFQPFLIDDCQDSVEIEFEEKEEIDFPKGNPVFKNVSFAVYEQNGQWIRIYHDYKENEKPYGKGWIISDIKAKVVFKKGVEKFFCESKNSFSHIAFEELLLRQKAMILHSSFISTEYGGVLFSGPSGIGKSTQADLWRKYKKAELINGDRTIVRKDDDVWTAYGSPYAGSSKCYVNKSLRISAIVMLQKGSNNNIRKASLSEAFVKVYSGMIVNTWNSEYIEQITELVYQLIQNVPVYLFSATADSDAVQTLENVLKKENRIES